MFIKGLSFIFIIIHIVSCHSVGETIVSGQDNLKSNGSISRPITDNSPLKISIDTFAKAFVRISKFDNSKNTVVYAEHLIEFKSDDSKISIFIDSQQRDSVDVNTNSPEVIADFRESDDARYFVLVIAASAGTCGDGVFAVVKITADLNVEISKPDTKCQGESYPIKIENIDKSNKFYRQISIGDLKFNLDKFDWIN